MDHTFSAAYVPIIVIIILMFAESSAYKNWVVIKKQKGRRGLYYMSDYLKKFVGKKCFVSTGSFGTSITGTIMGIEDKWMEIEVKENKPKEIINLEFVQRMRVYQK